MPSSRDTARRHTSRIGRRLRFALVVSAAGTLWLVPPALAQVSFSGPTSFAANGLPTSVAVADFNGDGDPDLAVANRQTNDVSVRLGAAGGSFAVETNYIVGNIGTTPSSVAVGDFNADGDPDFVTANVDSSNVSVRLGAAGNSFGTVTNFGTTIAPNSVAVGDFNADGDPDLAVASAAGFVSVLLGAAGGTFGAATDFAAGVEPFSIAVGDFNADGDPDLAVANRQSNVSVLLGVAGGGGFGPTAGFAAGTAPNSVAVGDFNGDGDPDLAVTNQKSANVSVLLGAAAGGFGTATNFAVGNQPNSVAVGDFNGDGDPDLAVANIDSNNVSVLLGVAGGGFGVATEFVAGNRPSSVAVGDFDADSDLDLAVANEFSGDVSVLLNTTPQFPRPQPPVVPLPQPQPPTRALPLPAITPSCQVRGIVLVGSQPGGTKARPTVRLVGTADRSLAGRPVTALRNDKVVARTRIALDGTVRVVVRAPRGRAARAAARYRLAIGQTRSQALKASRRARITSQTKLTGGRVRVKGQISATGKRRTLTIRSTLVCNGRQAGPNRTVRTDTRGRFTLVLEPPPTGQSTIYRIFRPGSKLVTLPIVLGGTR